YFGEPVAPMPAIRSDSVSAPALAAITGTYQFGPDYYVPNAKVRIQADEGQVEAAIEGTTYALVPIDDTRFLIRSFWVPADFTLGPAGRALEMRIDGFKGRRIR
ncbi:MAG: hypothetical protein M3Q57_04055, partial [Pseudomonadota bacterium]|nr:hypothetical protein [Pseudomonadota bacterium]